MLVRCGSRRIAFVVVVLGDAAPEHRKMAGVKTPWEQLRVVMVEPRNPLNIGAAARAMSNFDVPHLRVVNPYEVAFRQARSAMVGASLLARAEEFKDISDAVADCSLVVGTTAVGPRELQHPLRRLEVGARLIRKHLLRGRVALLFGSERYGLSKHDLSHCQWLMRIPTDEEHDSMNLGQAVAVCLYEIVRSGKSPGAQDKKKLAAASETERVTEVLFTLLQDSGYVKQQSVRQTNDKVRRMVRRFQLDAYDTELLLGMLRQISWKLGLKK